MEIRNFFVNKNETIINSIKALDNMGRKIILVVEEKKLLGVVTDGDIRRWILKNGSLEESVKCIMNPHPIYITQEQRHQAKDILIEKRIEALPVVNYEHEVMDIIFLNDSLNEQMVCSSQLEDIPVVIMAGGKGTRLYPYTKILPKPLIPIGDLTIIEHIMNKFQIMGCNQFYLTVNYKKNMIKAYLEDKAQSCEISYVEEEKFLGTGGSLHLLKDTLKGTFFVSNCDILVDADYNNIIKYHRENGYKITMITSLKNYVIPYGVVEVHNGGYIKSIKEKPEFNFQVNTGLYVLEAEVLKDIPEDEFYHITELINKYVAKGEQIGIYPITGNAWLDMGEIKEMENMVDKLRL